MNKNDFRPWLNDPRAAFAEFVRTEDFVRLGRKRPVEGKNAMLPVRENVAKIYEAMFGTFIDFLDERGKKLQLADVGDLLAFLDRGTVVDGKLQRELNSGIARRYMRIIERIYQHLGIQPNPVSLLLVDPERRGVKLASDDEPVALSPSEQEKIMAALPACISMPRSKKDVFHGWKRIRDRAMIAMMLGAGLKVSEIIALPATKVGKVQKDGTIKITVPAGLGGGVIAAHETILHAFAVQTVQHWILMRRKMTFSGDLLFPANLEGEKLSRATVYRQVRETFQRAGIETKRWGGRTLRNSFAVRELASGTPAETVKDRLGLQLARSTEKYLQLADNVTTKTSPVPSRPDPLGADTGAVAV